MSHTLYRTIWKATDVEISFVEYFKIPPSKFSLHINVECGGGGGGGGGVETLASMLRYACVLIL